MLRLTDRAAFFDAYLGQLRRLGLDRAVQIVNALPAAGRPVVFLCFEDIRKMGVVCHRQILAAWIEDTTEVSVKEYPVMEDS